MSRSKYQQLGDNNEDYPSELLYDDSEVFSRENISNYSSTHESHLLEDNAPVWERPGQGLLLRHSSESESFEASEFIGQGHDITDYNTRSFSFQRFELDESELYKSIKSKNFNIKTRSSFKVLAVALVVMFVLILYSFSGQSNTEKVIEKTAEQTIDSYKYNMEQLRQLSLANGRTFLRLIHTNDLHSKLDMFSDATQGNSCVLSGTKSITGCIGGLSRVKTAINMLRSDLTGLGDSFGSVLVDSGDQIQGSYYYNYFKGEPIKNILKPFKYDAMTLGNHEFDEGPSALARHLNQSGIPVVSCNIYIEKSKEPALYDIVKPYIIIEKYNLGIIGVTTDEAKWTSSAGPNINFFDTAQSVNEAIENLHKMGIKRIILLSHLGYDNDVGLASQIKPGVSVIVGGHSHSFLYSGGDKKQIGDNEIVGEYPTTVTNDKWTTYIVQAKSWGEYVGVLDVVFDSDGRVISDLTKGSPIRITDEFKEDQGVAEAISKYQTHILNDLNIQIGNATGDISLSNSLMNFPYGNLSLLKSESPMGNLITSSIMRGFNKANVGKAIDFALISSGMIRQGLKSGPVYKKSLITALPYNNTVSYQGIKGSALVKALNGVLSGRRDGKDVRSFVYMDGVRFNWTTQESADSSLALKVDKVYIKKRTNLAKPAKKNPKAVLNSRASKKINISSWELLKMDKTYSFATIEFLAEGGDHVFLEEDIIDLENDISSKPSKSNNTIVSFNDNPPNIYSMVFDYMKSSPSISPILDGRCASNPLF